jgi:magnesium-transporting ATPase (P-type)
MIKMITNAVADKSGYKELEQVEELYKVSHPMLGYLLLVIPTLEFLISANTTVPVIFAFISILFVLIAFIYIGLFARHHFIASQILGWFTFVLAVVCIILFSVKPGFGEEAIKIASGPIAFIVLTGIANIGSIVLHRIEVNQSLDLTLE